MFATSLIYGMRDGVLTTFFYIGLDGFTDFTYQVGLKHWCQTLIVTFNEKNDHRVFTLETSIRETICAGIKGKDIRKAIRNL